MEGFTRELQSLRDGMEGNWGFAHQFCIDVGLRRNALAEQAARDHRGRAERLLDTYKQNVNAQEVKAELRACRDHAEAKEAEFNEYSRTVSVDDHSYAEWIHHDSAERYRACLRTLEGMDLVIKTSNHPAASSLQLLFGTDGGQSGEYTETLEIFQGCESSVELDSKLSASVMAKASAGGKFLGAQVSAEVGAESGVKVRAANSYMLKKCSKRTVHIRINLCKPCYVYQLLTKVPLNTGHDVTLWGGYFSSRKQITL